MTQQTKPEVEREKLNLNKTKWRPLGGGENEPTPEKNKPDKHWDGVGCVCTYCARCSRWWAFKGPAKDFWKLFIVCASVCVCLCWPIKVSPPTSGHFCFFFFFFWGSGPLNRSFVPLPAHSVCPSASLEEAFFSFLKEKKNIQGPAFWLFFLLAPSGAARKVDNEIMWVKCDVI